MNVVCVFVSKNCSLKVPVFPLLSIINLDPFFRDEILVESWSFDKMKHQKALLDL